MGHCIVGPSSLERRMECPGSLRMELPHWGNDESSEVAEEGSMLHDLCATCSTLDEALAKKPDLNLEQQRMIRDILAIYDNYKLDGNELFFEQNLVFKIEPIKSEIELVESFVKSLTDGHSIATANEFLDGFRNHGIIFTGTDDFMVYNKNLKLLIVRDLKFGRCPVDVSKDNIQLAAYGLASKQKFPDIESVDVGIIQPRLNIMDESYTYRDFDVLESSIVGVILDCFRPNAKMKAGDHCKYCSGKVECQEYNKQVMELAKVDVCSLPPVSSLSDSDLERLLEGAKLLEEYVKDQAKPEAIRRCRERGSFAGRKLFDGKKTYKVKDISSMFFGLNDYGIKESDFLSCCSVSKDKVKTVLVRKIKEKEGGTLDSCGKIADNMLTEFFDVSIGEEYLKKVTKRS